MENPNKVYVIVSSDAMAGTFELCSENGAFEDLEEAKLMAEVMNQESERHGLPGLYLVVGLYLRPYEAPTKHLYSVHLTEPAELETPPELCEDTRWEQLELPY